MTARSAINLLPWREVARARRSRVMVGALAAALLAGVLLVWVAGWSLDRRTEAQERRNRVLEQKTALLEARIEEAQGLRSRRGELLKRMDVVSRLRNSRPNTVRVFDALVSTRVDGIHYERVKRRGREMEVEGFAASNRLVSVLMRNLEGSSQFTSAQLKRLWEDQQNDAYGPLGSMFEMTFVQLAPQASVAMGGEGREVPVPVRRESGRGGEILDNQSP